MNARIAAIFVAATLFDGAISASPAQEQTAVGLWQKQHDQSREPISWFLMVERDGVVEGYIAKLFPAAEHMITACTLCTDDRKDAPPLGLPFMRGMKRVGTKYEGGTVLDPHSGKISDAWMGLIADGQRLAVQAILVPRVFAPPDIWHRLPESAFAQLDPAIVSIRDSARGVPAR